MKTARERYAVVRGFGLCFHCLLGAHLIRDCKNQTSKTCGKAGCDKHHHELLHRDGTVSCSYEEYFDKFIHEAREAPYGDDLVVSEVTDISNHVVSHGGTSVNVLVCSINAKDRLKRYPIITLLDLGS